MIKGLTVTHSLPDGVEAAEVADLLATLGLEPASDRSSAGASTFLLPVTRLELTGSAMRHSLPGSSCLGALTDGLCIEVTGLDDIRILAGEWIREKARRSRLGSIIETDPERRFFKVEVMPGQSIAFWEWSHPLKGKPVAVAGDLSAVGMRFAIVAARWNAVVTDRLLQGAFDALTRSGARPSDIEIVRVPGAWEIPSAARKLAELGRFNAIISLGLLLRGETAHYEVIHHEVSRGLGQSQQETGVPHTFGVLTCETLEEALDRAGLKAGNKGFEAACAAIEMGSLHRKLAA